MPVTYTNRKGHTYYLCQGMTKTGKLRYYFAREPKDGSPDQIPEGYQISESVNGVVSLVKDRPQLILPQEVASIEAALDRHPQGYDYRVAVQKNHIVIYERLEPNVETVSAIFGKLSLLPSDIVFSSEGIEILNTPYRAPRANVYAERWVRSVREECLDHILVLNEKHLHRVLREYRDITTMPARIRA